MRHDHVCRSHTFFYPGAANLYGSSASSVLSTLIRELFSERVVLRAYTKDNVNLFPARRAQELCESRGGCPGLPSLINLQFLWM